MVSLPQGWGFESRWSIRVMSMRIEAFSTCFNYGDFLKETSKFNAGQFDRWVIATSPEDEETRAVCRKHAIECILTDEHTKDGGFNKGHVVERLLQHSSADCWRIHIDSDIVLPSNFRRILEQSHLDETKIYGCDRIMVKSWDDWQKLLAKGWWNGMQMNPYCVVFPNGYEVGARWASPESSYCPVGFAQIFHAQADEWWGNRIRGYPRSHNTACRSDIRFSLLWDRRHRELLPELIVAHLESEPSPNGVNWKGRKSPRFGPKDSSAKQPVGSHKPDCIS